MAKQKIGRNDQCPCGSKKKYKYCHGILSTPNFEKLKHIAQMNIERYKALEHQRQKQQGLGKPIIFSQLTNGTAINVNDKIYFGPWKTFHDFLMDYIKKIFGNKWATAELQKPYEKRHPLIKIFHEANEYIKNIDPGTKNSLPMIGAGAFIMWLSNNLYLISHNSKLESTLRKRLKNPEQFSAACYETYVAAMFIKAGFEIIFENESDGSSSHGEFIATHKKTGEQYCIEAKQRERKNILSNKGSETFDFCIHNSLFKALKKDLPHKRVIFIDVNLPMSEIMKYKEEDYAELLRNEEKNLINGCEPPSAYVFITNFPFHYETKSLNYVLAIFADGFKISDLAFGKATLSEMIDAREKHKPIYDLLESIKEHTRNPPSTFDGQIPEFAFNDAQPRLMIGEKYSVPAPNGGDVEAELTQAIVIVSDKKAVGIMKTNAGQSFLHDFSLSDEELSAYEQHPDTFFGRYIRPSALPKTPLEMYDSLYEQNQNLTKEELLNLDSLKAHPNYATLPSKSKEDLARIHCEALVNTFFRIMNQANHV